jgi:hypothetical protein
MAKTVIDPNGRMRTIVDSRKIQLEKQFDLMENALRNDEKHFTKKYLAITYGLETREVWAFLKLMISREVLAQDPPVVTTVGQRPVHHEPRFHIVDRPTPTPFSGGSQKQVPYSGHVVARRMRGHHLCDRCGAIIPGTGRHRKSSRGHTREKCDLEMVRVIHES